MYNHKCLLFQYKNAFYTSPTFRHAVTADFLQSTFNGVVGLLQCLQSLSAT